MLALNANETKIIETAQARFKAILNGYGISLHLRNDFDAYRFIRRDHGDDHLNQAFDARHVKFGDDDFWILAENEDREAIATYCLRRFVVDDFYDLIRSLALWFSIRPRAADPRYIVQCRIPPFGGEVVHGGGLWIRKDYRGSSRLAVVMPHVARAVALRNRPFDHDSAMIRNDPRRSAGGRRAQGRLHGNTGLRVCSRAPFRRRLVSA